MRPWFYRLCKLTAGTNADAALYGAWRIPQLSALGQGISVLLLLLGLLGLGNRAEAQVSFTQITNIGVVDLPSINADGTKFRQSSRTSGAVVLWGRFDKGKMTVN